MEHSVKLSIKNLGKGKRHKNNQIMDGQTQKQIKSHIPAQQALQ